MNSWKGSATWQDSTTLLEVEININSFGLSVIKEQQELFFTRDEFFVSEFLENGYVKIVLERASIQSTLTLNNVDALSVLKQHQFLLRSKPLFSLTSRIILLSVIFLLFIVFVFTLGADALSTSVAKLVPVETETELGQVFFQEIVSTQPIANDSSVSKVLHKCAKVVAGFSKERMYQFKIVILEDSIKNAFALPGGYIVIHRGMLDLIENQDEFFGLLGHESGHVFLQHGFKRIVRGAAIGLSAAILFGDVNGMSALLLENSKWLLNLSHDRGEELAADEFGYEVLSKSGADTFGLLTLFEKMEGQNGMELLSFLSTHPQTKERLAFLKKRSLSHSSKKFLTDSEWQVLKRKK